MRYQSLDTLRGLAIIGMILFHANYMLEEIFAIDIFHFSDLSWYILGRAVGITFITVSGISLYLSIQNRPPSGIVNTTKLRFMILTTIALAISLVTYIFFYDQRISFGIMHFFAIATVLSLPFIRLGSWNMLVGIICLIIGYTIGPLRVDTDLLIPLGLIPNDYYSADYYPIFPWFGYYLIGYGAASWLYLSGYFDTLFAGSYSILRPLAYIGRHSLLVYVLHIPIIYGIIWWTLS